MKNKFKSGYHVSWNSEAGRVSGTIVRVHTRNFNVNGYTHHASAEAPQYEIKSNKTEHVAFHKGSALTRPFTKARRSPDFATDIEPARSMIEGERPMPT